MELINSGEEKMLQEDWFGHLNQWEEISQKWIGKIILLCGWIIGKIARKYSGDEVIPHSSDNMVPLAMEHLSPGHTWVPENSATLLKIYQPSIIFHICPLPEYLRVWRWFSPICREFTVLFWLLYFFWHSPEAKPTPLWKSILRYRN